MRISKISIFNYKSIKEMEFTPNKGLNAFIGANSTGKSNIFSAVNWLLSPTYPSFNSTTKSDHYLGKTENKISITLEFDDDNTLQLAEEWKDYKGNIHDGLNINGYFCKSETREQYCAAYLGVDRKIIDHMASNRWSIMGRILQEVNRKFEKESHTYKGQTKLKKEWLKKWLTFARDTLLFSVQDEKGQNIMNRFVEILQDESARQLNRPTTELKVDMNIYDPWNFYRTLQLIIVEEEMEGLELQASELGMGVQAALCVAILKAYAELNLANNCPIFIDEPELFLHPQAQRNFFNILKDLSEDKYDDKGNLIRSGTQVFYTTHSPDFLSAGSFNELFIVRKSKEKGTFLNNGSVNKFIVDLKKRKGIDSDVETLLLHYKNALENTGDSQQANEGFFARKIILVEGQSEALLLPYFFNLIKFDYIREGISIVTCGSKEEIDRFYRLYTEFGIPCYVIFDGDNHHSGTPAEKENVKRNKVIMDFFGDGELDYPDGKAKENYLGFEDEFENTLGFTTSKKGLDLYIATKEKMQHGEITIPPWVEEVSKKILILTDGKSVLLH